MAVNITPEAGLASGPLTEARLTGKRALVTGAARGLGRAYALRLAALGADVAISDIDLDSAREVGEQLTAGSVASEIENLGRRALAITVDVSDPAAVRKMVTAAEEELGGLDILVCNAGGLAGSYERSSAARVPPEDLHATLARNLYGTVYCCQAAVQVMRKAGGGKIVTVSSEWALRASKGGVCAAYGAAKAGIIAYTMFLAEEVGPDGITVNAIAPGYIHSSLMVSRIEDPEADAAKAGLIAARRWGSTEDCARVVQFLASPMSDYVTGQVIVVDGGMSLLDPLG
jgi:NAD(P)-dependent dehydrogenase (short-subunit alcohol dehydrogenase family)